MAVAEKDPVLEGIVDDVVKGFMDSSERERLKKVVIHGGDEKSRDYVCKEVMERLSAEIDEVVSNSSFIKLPDSYSYNLDYFLSIARSQEAQETS